VKRLRHPIRAIREPFGTAGLIVAMVALVAALGGTALAASKLNSTQKKEVEKIAKKYAGKPGAPGAQGPAGPTGAAGKDGANGVAGKDGAGGAAGKDGVDVTFSPASEAACAAGGSVFKAANGETTICNGETGFTETLPPGATETGAWGGTFQQRVEEEEGTLLLEGTAPLYSPISFPIPLPSAISAAHVVKIAEGATVPAECDNGGGPAPSGANPEADPGYLCVFVTVDQGGVGAPNITLNAGENTAGAGTVGALVVRTPNGTTTPGLQYRGTFAVTACGGTEFACP
jgi:hypothetical protein